MPVRRVIATLSVLLGIVLLATPAASAAYDPVIPGGAKVGGVDVGGLTLSQAAVRLEAELAPRLLRPIEVRAAGHRRTLTPRFARLEFDAGRSARRANIAARRTPLSPDGLRHVDVQPWISYDEDRLDAFTRRVQRPVAVRARDARLRFSVTRLKRVRSREGARISRWALKRDIEATLVAPAAPRTLRADKLSVEPRVTTDELADRYPTVVTVHRNGFRLRLFKDLKLAASYPVAVGMPGHSTPRGRFSIANKAVNPAWTAPDRPWAGAYRNEVVAGGAADNPLRARWMGIVNGVGIHGTNATGSLGSRASHGCIRMSVANVKALYPRVPVGTPVFIK